MMFRSRHQFCLQLLATLALGAAMATDRLEAKTTTTPSTAGVSTSTKNTPPVKTKAKTSPTKSTVTTTKTTKVNPLDLPAAAKTVTNTAKPAPPKAITPTTIKKTKAKKAIANATAEGATPEKETAARVNDSNKKPESKPVGSGIEAKKPESKPSQAPPDTAATKANTNTPVNQQEQINLLIKLSDKQVHVFKGDKLIVKYPIAIGKEGWETPVGEWKVMELIRNPGWTNFKNGQVMAPGPDNPLGERWIGFWSDGKDSIGFHGTSNVKSIGTAASHGCVRMYNRDVRVLFNLVQVGTPVKVVK